MNFKKMSLDEKKKLYQKAMYSYHNEKRQIITDREFDKLEDLIRAEEPTWETLGKTGVRTFDRKLEVKLTEFMPSLDKAYPDEADKFVRDRIAPEAAIQMDKLDGTSLQPRYLDNVPYSLTTRGDGELGRDVTYLIPALVEAKRIPERIDMPGSVVLRVEGVMKKKTFEEKWSVEALGEEDGQDNARQLCNGVFLRKEAGPEIPDIDLKVLGVYGMTIPEGLEWAQKQGFDVVNMVRSNLPITHSEVFLGELLNKRREEGEYEIDGLVVTDECFVLAYDDAKKPKDIWAFKVNDEENAHSVTVRDIEYSATRTGKISIVAVIPPTRMDGVIVERVTVHNAAWMLERGIGPGAVIKVLRSGGVIPKIVDVVSAGTFKAPPWPYRMEGRFYVIDKNVSDAIGAVTVQTIPQKDIDIAQIRFFVTELGIELLAEKTIEKLHDIGLCSAADYILLMELADEEILAKFQSAGLGEGQSKNLLVELSKVLKSTINLKTLMVASGCMGSGIGKRKLSSIEDAEISMDEITDMAAEEIEKYVLPISGWQEKTVAELIAGVQRFNYWLHDIQNIRSVDPILVIDGSLPTKVERSGILAGKKICFTGYRSPEQAAAIEAQGGEIAASFGSSTDVLLYKADGKASGKVAKAGERAMTWDQFVSKYGLP